MALDIETSIYDELLSLGEAVLDEVRGITSGGSDIDAHQVLVRKMAGWATRIETVKHILDYSRQLESDACAALISRTVLCETAQRLLNEVPIELPDLDIAGLEGLRGQMQAGLKEENYRNIGLNILESQGVNHGIIFTDAGNDSDEQELRLSTRKFARDVIAPRAEEIHRQDLLVPEEFISKMGEMGYFGMSVPEKYGGVGMSNLMMVLATEELSAASLSAAGSLITRPEILAKALLAGGTEGQKEYWLPKVASGERMVAVAVTEPNIGSDVAGVTCRATEAEVDGKKGYVINGAKAWCTFAGRANILALLARTQDGPGIGHKGLSLFIVEKDSFPGHEFEMVQGTGGRLTGKADATVGYRGMHSYTLQFEEYFVPAENLVGGEDGVGKGFYLQMGGFAVGRLQTGGRAVGLSQASLETTVQYVQDRPQFGKPIAEFQSTQYELGRMAVAVEAARQMTYAAARSMDRGDADASLKAAMAKLYACRVAVDVSQTGQLLHGGWGYAEEYAISRYVADALVLPIFEGVEPILEMKVIGRGLLSA